MKQKNKECVQGFFKNLPAKVGDITNRVAMPVSRLTSFNEKNVFTTAKKGKYGPWVSVGGESQLATSNLPKSQSNTWDKFFLMHKVGTPSVTCQQPRESLMKKKSNVGSLTKETDLRLAREGDTPMQGGKIEQSGLGKSMVIGKQQQRHDSLAFRQTEEDFEVVLTKVEDCSDNRPKKPLLAGLLGVNMLSLKLFAQLGEKNKKLAIHSRASLLTSTLPLPKGLSFDTLEGNSPALRRSGFLKSVIKQGPKLSRIGSHDSKEFQSKVDSQREINLMKSSFRGIETPQREI